MPNARNFLLIGMLVVLFLLWQAWQTDYARPPVPVAADTPAAADGTVPAAVPNDVPAPANDTPDAPPSDAPAAPAAEAASTATSAGEQITVETDVLRLVISSNGGSVVSAELLHYPVKARDYEHPVQILAEKPDLYFVAQSGIVSRTGAAPDHRARYEVEQTKYVLADGVDTLEVPLHWRDPSGVRVDKTYVLQRGDYAIKVRHAIHNDSAAPWTGSVYRQLQRSAPSNASGFSFTNPEQYSFVGPAWWSPEEKYEKLKFADFEKEPLKREITGGWAAMQQHYFFSAWIPPVDEKNEYASLVLKSSQPLYVIRQVATPATAVAPGAQAIEESTLFVGPKLQDRIGAIAPGLEHTVDYGLVTVLAQPLFVVLSWIHKLVGNWGWAIVLITLLLKLLLYPLSEAQYRSMAKMRKLQPRMAALKERYGDDRQKLNQAMMELYQKEKINPMGGCLPMLVQIPVFIALYWVLLESVELRQAPFIGWIQNLSDKDPYFVLPLLNGLAMFATQRLTPTAGMDPMQQKIMQMMPIVFSVMFAFFPAGLVLYWTVNGVLSLAQQWFMMRRVEGAPAKT
jgi:YidC/Oxa1 family membrane protein insertase